MKRNMYLMLGAGIFIVFLLVTLSGFKEVIGSLSRANYKFIFLAIILEVLSLLFLSLRWNTLLSSVDINLDILSVFRIVLFSTFVNNITPAARTGGEPVRAYLSIRDNDGSMEYALATVALDRLLDVFVFVLIIIVVISNMFIRWRIPLKLIIFLLLSILVIVFFASIAILISFHPRYGTFILSKIGNFVGYISEKWQKKFMSEFESRLMKYQKAMKYMASNRTQLTKALLFSVISTSLWLIGSYFSFISVFTSIGFLEVVSVMMAGTLVGMLPILPGGLGPTEAVNTLLFVTLGITAGSATAGVLAMRFVTFWIPTIIGLAIGIYFALNRDKFNIEDLITKYKGKGG